MFYIYQTIMWLIFLLFISSKIKKENRRILFSIVASFFSTLEIVAAYMTEKFIDYRFYSHMNLDAVMGHGFQFVTQSILFVGLFVFLSVTFYFISKRMHASILRHNKFFLPSVLMSFILLSVPNGAFNEIYKTYEILGAEEKDFNQALKDIGIPPEEYITPDELIAKAGKNIIVISIESLEQGFLGKNFDNITPNLTKLSTEWTFYNKMPVSPGGNWTAGSLYSHQVGIPAFFKGQGNAFFQGTRNVKLTGLGHILAKAGYNSKYIVGNAEFAGMSDVLNAYGIPTVSQNNSLGKYPKVCNGLNDYDLFQEAKLQISELRKEKKRPFALFLSTINTHFPNGIYDSGMEQFISKKENDLEFSAAAVDYLVNDFLDYLKNNNLLENTAIYIFPDHPLMGYGSSVHEKLGKSKRQLYLLTNVDENKLPKQTSNTLYQIDLPRMIIDGAEIMTNAKFLVDFMKNDDVIDFITNHKVELTTLNTASIAKKTYQNGIHIDVKGTHLIVKSIEDIIEFELLSGQEIFDITFNSEMTAIAKGKVSSENKFKLEEFDEEYKRLHLLVTINDGKIDTTYLGDKQYIGLYKKGDSVTYDSEDVQLIMDQNDGKKLVTTDKQVIQCITQR